MRAVAQPAVVPAEFARLIRRWAMSQEPPAAVFLFGSRARGDHGPDSDWDFAVVYGEERPSLDGLPERIDGNPVEWTARNRAYILRDLNLCSVNHAIAKHAVRLCGEPLPRPERMDPSPEDAWYYLQLAHDHLSRCLHELVVRWKFHGGETDDTYIAQMSMLAGDRLCQAVLGIRAVEVRCVHSVAEFCRTLARSFPDDPTLPALRQCGGEAHSKGANDRPVEPLARSAARMVRVLRACPPVVNAVCGASPPNTGLGTAHYIASELFMMRGSLEDIGASSCPPETLRQLAGALEPYPVIDPWGRKMADVAKRLEKNWASRDGK